MFAVLKVLLILPCRVFSFLFFISVYIYVVLVLLSRDVCGSDAVLLLPFIGVCSSESSVNITMQSFFFSFFH